MLHECLEASKKIWEEFAFKLRIFIGLQGTAVARMLREADAKIEPIKDEGMKLDREGKADEVALSRHIFCQLAQLVEGPPGLILRSMPEDNGFEAWRLLTHRHEPNQGMKALGQLRNILKPSFPDANCEGALLQWEAEVEKYERTFTTQAQDNMKGGSCATRTFRTTSATHSADRRSSANLSDGKICDP